MADSQQGVRHQSARDAAGTVDTYDGDLRALFNAVATVPAGSTFNEAFMLWLQSVTGSSADNINDLAALYASQQDDTYNWSSVGSLGLPTILDFNPVGGGGILPSSTFTRGYIGLYFDGTQYQQAAVDEARFQTFPSIPRHFLWEQESTNLVVESTDFSTYSITGLLTPVDNGVGAIGLNSYLMDASTINSRHRFFRSEGVVASAAYTAFAIVENNSGAQFFSLRIGSSATASYAVFDIINGTITETAPSTSARLKSIDGVSQYRVEVTSTIDNKIIIGSICDSGTPGTAEPSFVGSNEQINVSHFQLELGEFSTSPIITNGSEETREADSLTDVDWPAEASAVVDVTVDDPIVLPALGMTMLGFGSGAARIFAVDAPSVLRLFNGGINSFTVAATSYEGERHSYGMSLALNEGIVVDDESNNNTDVTGTPGQGTIYIGSDSALAGQPCKLHRVRIYDQTQTIAELEALF